MKTDGEPWCRECRKTYRREKNRQRCAAWWIENGATDNSRKREKYSSDEEYRQKVDARNRDWQKKNPRYELERSRRRKRETPEKIRQNQRDYRERNRVKIRERHRRWVEDNKDRNREYQQRYNALRRVRELENGGNVTLEKVRQRWNYFDGKCWMCGEQATDMDHVKPISKGGGSWASNLRPACSPCNVKKNAQWPWPPVS